MRDALTLAAGLALTLLVAALALPALIDWTAQRALVEERLKAVTGLDVVTTGPISVRLLPSPLITIGGARVGEADSFGTRLTARAITAEAAIGPLMRGEVQITALTLDGARLTALVRDGALVLPENGAAAPVSGVDRLLIKRSTLRLIDGEGRLIGEPTLALDIAAPRVAGPWRIEGEIGGRSVRITTGDMEAGRLRLRAGFTDAALRADFDGYLVVSRPAPDRIAALPDGQLTAALIDPGEGRSLAQTILRLQPDEAGAVTMAISAETPAAGRIEGDATWPRSGARSTVKLTSRRIDAGAWRDLGARAAASLDATGLWPLMPVPDRIDLASDLVLFQGEEISDARLSAERHAGRWRPLTGTARFAGARVTLAPDARGEPAFQADIPDSRRIALALERLGQPAGLAADIGLIGPLSITARPDRDGAWRFTTEGPIGRIAGDWQQAGNGVALNAQVRDADLAPLLRPAAALLTLVRSDLSLQVTADNARIERSPPGTGRLVAARQAGRWRIDEARLTGFDGLDGEIFRAHPQAALSLRLTAQRAAAIAALAGRLKLSPEGWPLPALGQLEPVELTGAVLEREGSVALDARGRAGALEMFADASLSAGPRLASGRVTLAAPDRGALFQALGLPVPAGREAATRAEILAGEAGASLIVSGADGLRLSLTPAPQGRHMLEMSAPAAAAVLPAWLPLSGPALPVMARATLAHDEDGLRLAGLVWREGAATIAGELARARDGAVSGNLGGLSLDLMRLMSLVTGAPSGHDSAQRFGAPRTAPALDVALTGLTLAVPELPALSGNVRLRLSEQRLTLDDIALTGTDGLALSGKADAERSGGLLSLRLGLDARNLMLERLPGGTLAGRATLTLQLGASGETPQRLLASLAGAGEITPTSTRLIAARPQALADVLGQPGPDNLAPAELANRLSRALAAGDWVLPERPAVFLVSGGVARLSALRDERDGSRLVLSGTLDLRQGTLDARATLTGRAPPDWTGPSPQVAIVWTGPWRQPVRALETAGLRDGLAQRALQRELDRLDAQEADIRERQMFNRRLRGERGAGEASPAARPAN